MAETMIERVARAMCEATGTIWGGPRGEDDPDFLLTKMYHMNMARAAIEAMRHPSAEVVEAGNVIVRRALFTSTSVWEAMIDAALAEA